jgi:hypothetical protein
MKKLEADATMRSANAEPHAPARSEVSHVI